MNKTATYILIGFAAAFLLAPRISALFYEVEGVTVRFADCQPSTPPLCEIYGTLRMNPFDLRYRLEKSDGTIIEFERGSYSYMSWPAPSE